MARIHFEGPEALVANQLFWAQLTVEIQEEVFVGGRIAIAVRHVTDFGTPQIVEPDGENYVGIAFSRSDVAWEFDPELKWYRHPWNLGFELVITDSSLAAGDTIEIKLGGNAGYRCQSFVEDKFRFRVGVQPEPEARWIVADVDQSPGFRVLGNAPSAIEALCPISTAAGQKGASRLIIQDAYGNPATLEDRCRSACCWTTPGGCAM